MSSSKNFINTETTQNSIFTNINWARLGLIVLSVSVICVSLFTKVDCSNTNNNNNNNNSESRDNSESTDNSQSTDNSNNINEQSKTNKCPAINKKEYFIVTIISLLVVSISLIGIQFLADDSIKRPGEIKAASSLSIAINGFFYFPKKIFQNLRNISFSKFLSGMFKLSVISAFIWLIFYIGSAFIIKTTLLVGALALIYLFTKDTITSKIFKLIFSIIFYIPCLFIDLFEYLHQQYNISTSVEWSILGFEIILGASYILIPKIYGLLMKNRSVMLQGKPIYTNQSHNITNNQQISKIYNPYMYKTPSSEKQHNYNYAISLWSYINPQPPNTNASYENFTPIFSYEKKPEILYKGATNEMKIIMQSKNNDEIIVYEMENVPLQKWNHIVINYIGGTLDIFFNNKLVSSEINVVPYMNKDSITVGNHNGVHGGMCNIEYFKNPLSKFEINMLYNANKSNDPPTQ